MRTLFLVCSFFIATISTAQAATVNVVPSSNTVNPFNYFSVLVSGSGFPETGGATLGLSFDPSVVKISGISLATGSPFDYVSSSAFDNVTGQVQFISLLAPLVGALPSGNFDAFRIDFNSMGAGAANISLIEDGVITGWTDASASPISGITYNQANVTGTVVPLPAAGWLLLSGLGMLVSTKRFAFGRR